MYKNKYLLLALLAIVAFLMVYFSPENRIERNYAAMIKQGKPDLAVLDAYLQLHEPLADVGYNRALNQAALLDESYLQKLVEQYAQGSIILSVDAAEHILSRLPSESLAMNLAAGRIYAADEFGLQNPGKAVQHLSYVALRGNGNAARHLVNVYLKANCPVEAATWSKVVDASDDVSPCGQLPVDVNRFSDAEWESVLLNSDRIIQARKTGENIDIKYRSNCPLSN